MTNGKIECIAHCIEYDEKFLTKFYASKNCSKDELLKIGNQIAAEGWGATCYKVTKKV